MNWLGITWIVWVSFFDATGAAPALGGGSGLAFRDPSSGRFVRPAEVAVPEGRELSEVVVGAPRRAVVERAVAGPAGGYRVGLRESGRAVSAVVAWRGEEGEVLVGCGPEDPGHGAEVESDAESAVPTSSAGRPR